VTLTVETLVKTLAAIVLPSLAWLLSVTSDLSRDQQRLEEVERRIEQLERSEAEILREIHHVSRLLSETTTTVRFIREELLP